jgi:hypothetical protein
MKMVQWHSLLYMLLVRTVEFIAPLAHFLQLLIIYIDKSIGDRHIELLIMSVTVLWYSNHYELAVGQYMCFDKYYAHVRNVFCAVLIKFSVGYRNAGKLECVQIKLVLNFVLANVYLIYILLRAVLNKLKVAFKCYCMILKKKEIVKSWYMVEQLLMICFADFGFSEATEVP